MLLRRMRYCLLYTSDLKVIKYVEDKIERKEIDVKDALRKIDELEERLTYIDKQFKDCAWRLRELTKE